MESLQFTYDIHILTRNVNSHLNTEIIFGNILKSLSIYQLKVIFINNTVIYIRAGIRN